MSAPRRWPEGLPALPAPAPEVLMLAGDLDYQDGRSKWFRARADLNVGEFYASPAPMVLREGLVVTHINAAARALGIVPDDEQEPNND